MKITIVLGAFLPVPPIMGGAVEKIWFLLAPKFTKRGHDVTMVSRAVSQLPRDEIKDGVHHIRVRGFDAPGFLPWLKFLDLIYSWRVKSILPVADIIVTNTFWLPLLLRNSDRGRVYVHVARYPKGQMRFYGKAARLQAPSTAVAEAIVEQAPELKERTKVVPYPAPVRMVGTEPSSISERGKVMLYVGRVHPEKGVHLLVSAFAQKARTVFADWNFMIVGPIEERFGGGGSSYMRALRQGAESAAGRVTFRGAVFDPAELEKIFQAARLFVYPSLAERGESFGLAPLEAMTHGCAVLVSNLACFRDFIQDNRTGFVFDHRADDPGSALGQRLEQIATDETLLTQVAKSGQDKAVEYSLPQIADRFLGDFNSLVEDSKNVRSAGR